MESTVHPEGENLSGSLLRDRYELIQPLGQGGFAVTYLAQDRQTGRKCVVKELSWERVDDWKFIELFEREARVLSNLNHPQIPAFIDYFTEPSAKGSRIFLVQEFIQGRNLRDLICDGKHFTPDEVIEIALKVTRILQYLHNLAPPIIHRDIKPSNILIDDFNEVHLVDFGAVRDKILHSQKTEGSGFTVVGTYGYMPFEQFQGKAVPASDLYSLGATMVYLLSHKEPHEMESIGSRLDLEHHLSVSPSFMSVLHKLLAHDVTARYQSAEELEHDLQSLLDERTPAAAMKPPTTRQQIRPILVVALLVAVFAGLWSFYTTQPIPDLNPPTRVEAPLLQQAPLAQARAGEVPGLLFYDGEPVTMFTKVRPNFWFRNEDTGKAVTAEVEYRDGAFRFKGLVPGSYGVQATIDANMQNRSMYPGDYYSWTPFQVTEGQNPQLQINLQKVIHLRSPEDNDQVMPHWTIEPELMKVHARAPLTFKWNSLGPNVQYDYSIAIWKRPYQPQGSAASGTTMETEVTVNLPANSKDDYYILTIHARRDGRRVGLLMTHGSSGMGWDYRFRIDPE